MDDEEWEKPDLRPSKEEEEKIKQEAVVWEDWVVDRYQKGDRRDFDEKQLGSLARLLKGMFAYKAEERLTMAEVLAHDFFTEKPQNKSSRAEVGEHES